MKRRRLITAIGTLAVGSGTVLGTGAFDATASSSDASLSIVSQGEDANIDITKGSDAGSGDIKDGLYTSTEIGELNRDDLPVAAVANPGDNGTSMVNIQVIGEVGTSKEFTNIIEVTNNSSNQSYEVGFIYEGGFTTEVTDNADLSKQNVASVFKFRDGDGTTISDVDSPSDMLSLDTTESGSTQQLSLKFDGKVSALKTAYDSTAGDFGTDGAVTEQLIDQVTAVANEI